MNFRVFVSERAIDDVVRNVNWWANNRSPEEAVVWHEAIFKRIDSLSRMPKSNPVAQESEGFPYAIREAHFGIGSRPNYRILFTIVDDVVNVLTVRASEEDWISPDDFGLASSPNLNSTE